MSENFTVCLEERPYPVSGYPCVTGACPMHGIAPYTDFPVYHYQVEAESKVEAYDKAWQLHWEIRKQEKDMAKLSESGKKKQEWIVSINTIGGSPKIVSMVSPEEFEAQGGESAFGQSVAHYQVEGGKAEASQEALRFHRESTAPPTPPVQQLFTKRAPLPPSPGLGSLAVNPEPEKTAGGVDPQQALTLMLKQNPALAQLMTQAGIEIPGGVGQEEEEFEPSFRMVNINEGTKYPRKRVEVQYKPNKSAKIAASVFMAILEGTLAGTAQEFAHQEGLMELEDEGDDEEITLPTTPARTTVHINRIGR